MVIRKRKVNKEILTIEDIRIRAQIAEKAGFYKIPRIKKQLDELKKADKLEKEFENIYDEAEYNKNAIKKLPNWRRRVVNNFKNKKITKAQHDDLIALYDNWRLSYIEDPIYPRRPKKVLKQKRKRN